MTAASSTPLEEVPAEKIQEELDRLLGDRETEVWLKVRSGMGETGGLILGPLQLNIERVGPQLKLVELCDVPNLGTAYRKHLGLLHLPELTVVERGLDDKGAMVGLRLTFEHHLVIIAISEQLLKSLDSLAQ